MMVFTEAMARMVADLAETGGEMEIELHDDHVRIGYSPRKGGGLPGAAKRPAAERGGSGSREKLYKARNEAAGKAECHTLSEWCKIVGDGSSPGAIRQRIKKTGSVETAKRRSKFEKSDKKKRIST